MVIVSAGVIMNMILAGDRVHDAVPASGFNVPPAARRHSHSRLARPEGRPAARRCILTIDGKDQHDDWTKVQLNAALCAANEDTPITVERIVEDGQKKLLTSRDQARARRAEPRSSSASGSPRPGPQGPDRQGV